MLTGMHASPLPALPHYCRLDGLPPGAGLPSVREGGDRRAPDVLPGPRARSRARPRGEAPVSGLRGESRPGPPLRLYDPDLRRWAESGLGDRAGGGTEGSRLSIEARECYSQPKNRSPCHLRQGGRYAYGHGGRG